jgi:uncharacterized SAM-binding protein YcdF (DUF218 family)
LAESFSVTDAPPEPECVCYFRSVRRLFHWLFGAMLLFLVVVFTPLSYYAAAPLREPAIARKSDAIVLFSSGQIDDLWLTADGIQRTMGALLLYRQVFAPVIVCSGSQHALGLRQAELEAEWLERAGVPQSAIVIENQSTRTYYSVLAVREMMARRGWRSVVIVTSELDVPRIRLICRRLGLEGISFLAVPDQRRPRAGHLDFIGGGLPTLHHAVYEYAGLVLYKLKGWI